MHALPLQQRMETLAKFQLSHHPLPHLLFNQRLPSISNPFSVFRATSCPSIRVSCSSPFCSDPFRQNPKTGFLHSSKPISYTLLILTSVVTAALLFHRLHSKTLVNLTISPSISHSDHDSMTNPIVERKINHVQAIWHYKLQVNVENNLPLIESKLDHSWKLLKTQIYCHLSELEFARMGFEKLLENDPFQRKSYREKLVENLEMIDELKDLLGSVQMAMDKLDEDRNQFYSEIKSMVRRIRALEDKAIGTLKYYQELEKKEN